MVKKVGSDINSIKNTNDGGYIIGGNFHDSVELGNGITIQVRGYNSCADGMIIKYSKDDICEWAEVISGAYFDNVNSIIETSDGGYLAGGYFNKTVNLDDENTIVSGSSGDLYNGMIIKYDPNRNIEWAKVCLLYTSPSPRD